MHSTPLDGFAPDGKPRKGLRGYAATLLPGASKTTILSLDTRREDRAAWAGLTISAFPVSDLQGYDAGARVACELVYDVDGAGNTIAFDVPRLATIAVPAGFVRLRAGLIVLGDKGTPWTCSAQISLSPTANTFSRARVAQLFDVEKNTSIDVPVVSGCTDAELIVHDNSIQAALNVEAVLEGRSIDATPYTQRPALYGLPCCLPMIAGVDLWNVTSQIAGSVSLVQYLGP